MTVAAHRRPPPADQRLNAGPPLVEDEDFGFRMANLYPRRTGLPMTIWAGPRGGARHDVRIKVCMTPGDVMHWDQLATIAVRPQPQLLYGELSARDFARVAEWIKLNEAALLDHWNGLLDGADFAEAVRPLKP